MRPFGCCTTSIKHDTRRRPQRDDGQDLEARGDYLSRTAKEDGLTWTSEPADWCDANAKIALGYCIDVFTAATTERQAAWSYVADATKRASIAITLLLTIRKSKERASKAANARHAENRELKQFAVDWYLANRGEGPTRISKDTAAWQIAEKIVPAKFRTVRDWLSEVKD